MPTPLVTFLTDYGRRDPFVGLCHAVIAGLAPDARVVDLTHDIAAQDIRHGAAVLVDCLPWLPPAVHLAVVDPGVGTARRAAVVAAGGVFLVGPDNGLLWPAAVALGGVDEAWELDVTAPSRTFHGRDVFAPAAARLAAGAAAAELGSPMDPDRLVRLKLPTAEVGAGSVRAEVLVVDRFGNLQLFAKASALDAAGLRPGDPVEVAAGGQTLLASVATTFADVDQGAPAVLPDAFERVQIAVNQGSAAATLAVRSGEEVHIRSPAR